MSQLVRSELLKQRTTRTSTLLLVWMAGLILLVVLLHVLSLSTEHVSTTDGQLKIVGWGTSIGALFASILVFGIGYAAARLFQGWLDARVLLPAGISGGVRNSIRTGIPATGAHS